MSEQEFRALALSTIRQATPLEAARAINARLASEDPEKASFVRELQIIRDSIDIALSSKKRDIAESRMKSVVETWKRGGGRVLGGCSAGCRPIRQRNRRRRTKEVSDLPLR